MANKKIVIEIGDVEQKLLTSAIKAELGVFDKMIAMLLRQEQPDAVRPLLVQVRTLQKLLAQVGGEKTDEI